MVVLLGLSSSVLSSDDGLSISYQPPIVPVEFSFDEDGIDVKATKKIITPLGSFGIGYGLYKLKDRSDYEDDYTYVVIEDMNERKEHIYKVNDGKKLTLASEGRTNVEVTKNRVRILVEKGSNFKVSFEVEEESRSYDSDDKWVTPSDSVCRSNGGKVDNNGCYSKWEEAKIICQVMNSRLATIEEFIKTKIDCGGKIGIEYQDKNKENSFYQSCYKQKGFTSGVYWSYSSIVNGELDPFGFFYYNDYWEHGNNIFYVRCIKTKQ